MLSAGAAGAESIHTQFGFVQHYVLNFVLFGQDGHGAGAGVDTALRFGGGHALYTVRAAFELQAGIHLAAGHAAHHFLIAAMFAAALRKQLYLPALCVGVLAVHAEQIASEDGGFIATRRGTNF